MGADATVMVEPRSELGGRAEEALRQVYVLEYSALVGLARLLIDRREDAEDVVQEAFARTWVRLGRVRGDDPVPYIRRAVVNLARGRLRRRRTAAAPSPSVCRRRNRPSPARCGARARQALFERLRLLPRRQRECVVLRFYGDLSVAEIARTLGVAEGSVKSHLHRAITALALDLEDQR